MLLPQKTSAVNDETSNQAASTEPLTMQSNDDLTISVVHEPMSTTHTTQGCHDAESTVEQVGGLTLAVHVPPQEYMLGIADLTGEIMRLAINSVTNGDLERPAELCKFMRVIYDAFISFGNVGREMNQKSRVLKQSLLKVENACYSLRVRGSEIPQHMLKDVFTAGTRHEVPDIDEFECSRE